MAWTAVDHEGMTMWEQDGERVKEVLDERPELVIERVRYRPGVSPMWVPWVFLFGWLAGMLVAAALGMKL